MSRVVLTVDLCEQLLAGWRRQGAPIAGNLAPGLSEAEMDELTAPLGVVLPDEARVWWGWRNGPREPPGPTGIEGYLGPMFGFYSLEDAVEAYGAREMVRDSIEMGRRMGGRLELEVEWPAHWLPVIDTGSSLQILLNCADRALAPVQAMDLQDRTDHQPVAATFGEMVTVWVQALDSGAWCYDDERRFWGVDMERLPVELQDLPFV